MAGVISNAQFRPRRMSSPTVGMARAKPTFNVPTGGKPAGQLIKIKRNARSGKKYQMGTTFR